MMRMVTWGLFGLSLVTLGAPAVAHAEQKVGYVDMAEALNTVEDGKSAKAQLKKELAAKQAKLDKMREDLEKKKKAYDKQSSMMKPEVRAQKQQELQQALLELQQLHMQLQQELVGKEAKVTQEIADKLRKVVEKIGDRDGYDMIVDIGDTVLYYKRHRDLTEVVVKEYNRLYGKK